MSLGIILSARSKTRIRVNDRAKLDNENENKIILPARKSTSQDCVDKL